MVPEIFAPGVVSTAAFEGCIVFSPDGMRAVFRRSGPANVFVEAEDTEDGWKIPRVPAPFSRLDWYSGDFTLAPDGTAFYFTSSRPIERTQPPFERSNLWVVKWQDGQWSTPTVLPEPIRTPDTQAYPTVTADGTLYFFSRSPAEGNTNFLYRSRRIGEGYSEPERLPVPVNTGHDEYDPLVAPDDSFLIFVSNKPGGLGGGDFYISFKGPAGAWTEPVNMGEGVNSPANENRPFLTLDGRFFFFTSDRVVQDPLLERIRVDLRPGNGSRDIYWVDASIIDQLRPRR
jgi:Tol biopolymer transport system component